MNKIKATSGKSFRYKTKIIGSSPDKNSRLNAEVVTPLKLWVIFGDLSIYHWLTVK